MHNEFGERIETKDSLSPGRTIRCYYNYNWQILSDYDGSNNYKRSYIYGNYVDEVLLMRPNGPGLWYYVHDHLYSPVALLDLTGTPYERYEYDAYGKCYIMDGSYNPRSTSSYGNPFYFTGREMDFLDNSNLRIMNYRHRYYDTYTGRFTTHDPLGINPAGGIYNLFSILDQYTGGLNLYEYVQSNPQSLLDSTGTITIRMGGCWTIYQGVCVKHVVGIPVTLAIATGACFCCVENAGPLIEDCAYRCCHLPAGAISKVLKMCIHACVVSHGICKACI
jgi:RHS repeat-associated protein